MTEAESDVLIIGAGPAGSSAATVLARAGVRVTVLDRAKFPRDKVCGDAISNDGIQILGELGARADVEAAPHAVVRRAVAVFPDGTRIGRSYDRPGWIVPRLTLDDCIRRAAEDAGAAVVEGCKVTGLVREGGRVVGAEGKDARFRARVVIAADGYGSVGLDALGVKSPKDRYLGVSSTAYYRGVSFDEGPEVSDHYFDRELPLGYGWIFPAVDGVSNIGVYLRADGYARTGKKLRALLDDFLARHAERFRGAELVGKVRSWSLPLAPRPVPITAPGLLLAGDAAGFIDPLSGEGIWQALHTGVLAGEVARDAIRQGELGPVLRERYERACRRDIGGPSRRKAWVQRGMDVIVERRLYRLGIVRAALRLGYEHHALEMTKS